MGAMTGAMIKTEVESMADLLKTNCCNNSHTVVEYLL